MATITATRSSFRSKFFTKKCYTSITTISSPHLGYQLAEDGTIAPLNTVDQLRFDESKFILRKEQVREPEEPIPDLPPEEQTLAARVPEFTLEIMTQYSAGASRLTDHVRRKARAVPQTEDRVASGCEQGVRKKG